MRRTNLLIMILVVLGGCQAGNDAEAPPRPPAEPAPAAAVDTHTLDMHNSRNALDWVGTYEGLLACADCPGTHTRLTLERDGGFELVTRRLIRGAEPAFTQGRFEWHADGNTIALPADGQQQRFAVGEGRVLQLDAGQTQPAWGRADAILAQSKPAWRSTRTGLAEMLADHRWLLVDATNAAGQRLEALFPDPERAFAFNFAHSRMHVQGGCNGLRGAYRVDPDGMLEASGAVSTMMSCEPSLMEADAALSALLEKPLETVMIRGVEPRLVLLGAAGDALVLSGALTPEARFGAPDIVFLEVYEQRVTCEASVRSDGMCLRGRELTFDEQGLQVGTPSEWQVLNAEIQGYRHESGIRNILRVKRFGAAAEPGTPAGPIYVLDLVVQSEVMPE